MRRPFQARAAWAVLKGRSVPLCGASCATARHLKFDAFDCSAARAMRAFMTGRRGRRTKLGMSQMEDALRQAVEAAAGRADVSAAVRAVYDAVAAEVDRRRPTCAVSGRCCRFEEYGHRLYVTTLELAAFVAGTKRAAGMAVEDNRGTPRSFFILQPSSVPWDGAGCPFQISKLCGVHAIRPFGCRMFFCDPASTSWQNAAYERFHAELKALHEGLGVPYFYVEWRQALRTMGWASQVGMSGATCEVGLEEP